MGVSGVGPVAGMSAGATDNVVFPVCSVKDQVREREKEMVIKTGQYVPRYN